MNLTNAQTQSLIDLGFTPVEAEVYLFLLTESPASGYRIAQALGRPAAQVYKATEALQQKGAVIADEGKTKLCRALPIEAFLKHVDAQFQARKETASELLKDIPAMDADHRIYQLKTVEQVYVHAESMLNQAEHVAVMDLFPQPARRLGPLIEAATRRNVLTGVKVYEACAFESTETVVAPDARETLEQWPGQHLILAVDGRTFLWALLHDDETDVYHGIWSRNPYLSSLQHNGISGEIAYTRLLNDIAQGADNEDLRGSITRLEPFYLSNCVSVEHFLYRGQNDEENDVV